MCPETEGTGLSAAMGELSRENFRQSHLPPGGSPGTSRSLPVYVYDTHADAENAIRALSKSGIDVKKLSLIGKGYHSEDKALGFYTTGDRVLAWGGMGAFWGGIWGLLAGPAVFLVPGLGLLAMAGPVVTALVSALEGAVVVGGVSAVGAAFTSVGLPEEDAIRYEKALKAEKYILMVHGDAAQVDAARATLDDHPT